MSIFGKKTSGQETPEGDGNKPSSLEAPSFEQYVYQAGSANKAKEKTAMEAPRVQKAPPPTMTQAPSMKDGLSSKAQQQPGPATAQTQSFTPAPTASPGSPVAQSPYSIDDVIRLMRELPDSKKEMVVIIVQKTLISAKIDVGAIIGDAARKVDALTRGNDKLVAEIRELEEAIIQKKSEVERLNKELDETNSVKQIFEATYGRHVKGEGESSSPPQIKLF